MDASFVHMTSYDQVNKKAGEHGNMELTVPGAGFSGHLWRDLVPWVLEQRSYRETWGEAEEL